MGDETKLPVVSARFGNGYRAAIAVPVGSRRDSGIRLPGKRFACERVDDGGAARAEVASPFHGVGHVRDARVGAAIARAFQAEKIEAWQLRDRGRPWCRRPAHAGGTAPARTADRRGREPRAHGRGSRRTSSRACGRHPTSRPRSPARRRCVRTGRRRCW
jgi:hypothetical protein